jgi:hypothetical protein
MLTTGGETGKRGAVEFSGLFARAALVLPDCQPFARAANLGLRGTDQFGGALALVDCRTAAGSSS